MNALDLKAARKSLEQESYKAALKSYLRALKISPHLTADILLEYEEEIEKRPAALGLRLSLAGLKIELGAIDEAVLDLEEALEQDDKNIEVYNLLGKIYIRQEKTDEAISLLESSVQKGVRDVSLTEILAGAYLEKGKIKEASQFYQEVLNYRPQDKNILRVLGDLYSRLEEYHKAAQCYQAMFSEDPEVSREVIQRLEELLKKREGSVFIREILSDIYMKSLNPEEAVKKQKEIIRLDSSKLEEAVKSLKNILKNYPGNALAGLSLAEALRMQGGYSEAVETYHALAKDNPDYLGRAMAGYQDILNLCPEQILARTYLAECYLYQNQLMSALKEYEQMIKYSPDCVELVIKKAREILKSQPQLLYAHLVLGRAFLARNDLQKALLEAENVINIDKKYSEAYLLMGETYYLMKMCRRAAETLTKALNFDPYNRQIQEKYKEVKEKEVDLEISAVKEKLNQDQWKVGLHLDLAKLYLQRGEEEGAIRELQLAVKDQAKSPFALNLLGCIYRGQGRYDLAAAQFNRAQELTPKEIADFIRTVKLNIGTTYEARGEVQKALKIYESIMQENIDFGNLKQKVKYLKMSSLQSLRNRTMLMVLSYFGKDEIIALWGREARIGKIKKEEVSLSFGQNHNTDGYELFMKGMYKAALEEFQLAVQLDSQFASALNNWAIALAKEGRFSEAKNKLEEAVNINPNSHVFRNNLGVIYYVLGHLKNAKKELDLAMTLDPDSSAIAINLGDVNYVKGEIETAVKLYHRVGKFDALTEIADRRLLNKTA